MEQQTLIFIASFVLILLLCPKECLLHEASGAVSDMYDGLLECRRCPITNEYNLEACWDQSIDHFAEQLELSLNRYALALQYVNRWKHYHDKVVEYKGYETKRMNAVLDRLYPSKNDNEISHGPLSRKDVESVFELALNKSTAYDQLYGDEEETLSRLQCPTPCNYYPKVWMTLFIVTLVAFVSILVLFCIHACWRKYTKGSHILLVST